MHRRFLLPALLLAVTFAAPVPALAAGPRAAGTAPGEKGDKAEKGDKGERREKLRKRLKLMRTMALVDRLDLSESEGLKLSAECDRFDERREPLREQVRTARQTLKKAAQGEAEANRALDGALAQATEARKQLADLELEEYRALAKLVPAEKRAELALVLQEFGKNVQKLARGGGRPGGSDGDDEGPRGRRRGGPHGPGSEADDEGPRGGRRGGPHGPGFEDGDEDPRHGGDGPRRGEGRGPRAR